MCYSAYLLVDLIKNKGGYNISNFTKTDFFMPYVNQVLLGGDLTMCPLSPPLPFSLAKKRICLDTQLKGELTYFF